MPSKPWHFPRTPVWYSGRYKELLGYAADEFEDVLESWTSVLHPEDRQRTLETLTAHIERKEPYQLEFRLRTKEGPYRWFSSRGQAV